MKALTFLGMGNYQTVTYYWSDAEGEREWQTNLFPEAVARIFEPEKILVFVTEQAKASQNFQTLCQRLGKLVESVDIPEGKSEAELWQIFERVASSVEEGETVLLDITHAFRSIPMLVFAVSAYLRRTKGVTIERIIYGAFEARGPFRIPPQPEDRAPIFDLTPLLDLLDWLSGAEFFLQRGDAVLLGSHLEETHQRLWRERVENELPRRLQGVGRQLQTLSCALHLSRPLDVMRSANGLLSSLDEVVEEANRWAPPFAVLLEEVQAAVEPLAYEIPEQLDKKNLSKQLALIDYYLQKELFVQAILLAREWMVSWACLQRNPDDWLNRGKREKVEEDLNAAARKQRGEETKIPSWLKEVSSWPELVQTWDWLTKLRNDVAHCGMSQQATDIQSIKTRAQEIPQRLQKLLSS